MLSSSPYPPVVPDFNNTARECSKPDVNFIRVDRVFLPSRCTWTGSYLESSRWRLQRTQSGRIWCIWFNSPGPGREMSVVVVDHFPFKCWYSRNDEVMCGTARYKNFRLLGGSRSKKRKRLGTTFLAFQLNSACASVTGGNVLAWFLFVFTYRWQIDFDQTDDPGSEFTSVDFYCIGFFAASDSPAEPHS